MLTFFSSSRGPLLSLAILLSGTASAMDLNELYQKALIQSELIQSAKLDVDIRAAEKQGDLSLRKPRVNLNADGTYDYSKPDRSAWSNTFSTGVTTQIRQPLYDGGLSRSSIRRGNANIKASQWDYKSQEQSLYLQLADLFYDFLSQKQDLANLEDTLKLYRQRVKDMRDRERIGRSRDAEVLSAETQVELTLSQITSTKTNIGADEEQIAWLTGLPMPLQLTDSLKFEDLKPAALPKTHGTIPSVEAAQARIESSEATIDVTRSSLKPQLDLIGAHNWAYLDAQDQGAHTFSVGLGLTWTLYDAGSINSQVSAASITKNKAEVARQLADRQGGLDMSLARRKLVDNLEQVRAYRKALDVVEKTVKSQQREFDSGLIANIEMITTLDQRLTIRRNLDLATYRAKLNYIQTQVYGGMLLDEFRSESRVPAPDSEDESATSHSPQSPTENDSTEAR